MTTMPVRNVIFNLGGSNSIGFLLLGGRYAVIVSATWGGGSVDLQVLGPDGVTYVSILNAPFTANGDALVDLPDGTYRFVVATATAAFASVSPVRTNQF